MSAQAGSGSAAGIGRHLLSILALPFMNTVIIPTLILAIDGGGSIVAVLPEISELPVAGIAIGALAVTVGLLLVVSSIALFVTRGQGTLAPWDPPRRLVVSGPYRFVRNPMKAGLIFVLAGQALLLDSPALVVWCATFGLVNALYIRLSEEPGLRRRFGAAYLDYRAAVPAWLPRLTPWSPTGAGQSRLAETSRAVDEAQRQPARWAA